MQEIGMVLNSIKPKFKAKCQHDKNEYSDLEKKNSVSVLQGSQWQQYHNCIKMLYLISEVCAMKLTTEYAW